MTGLPEKPFLDEEAAPDAIELGAAMMFVGRYGSRTLSLVEDRVAALESEGDALGAALWRRVAIRVAELQARGLDH